MAITQGAEWCGTSPHTQAIKSTMFSFSLPWFHFFFVLYLSIVSPNGKLHNVGRMAIGWAHFTSIETVLGDKFSNPKNGIEQCGRQVSSSLCLLTHQIQRTIVMWLCVEAFALESPNWLFRWLEASAALIKAFQYPIICIRKSGFKGSTYLYWLHFRLKKLIIEFWVL